MSHGRLRTSRWLVMGAIITMVAPSVSASPAVAGGNPPDAPVGLTVNDNERPLEVEGTPLFGWYPQDADGNEMQTAYQLQVTRVSDGSLLWDSGKLESSDQSYVPYGGPSLQEDTSYRWTVRTWDRTDQPSAYAPESSFDTGISDGQWSGASWIRRTTTGNDSSEYWTLARKEFTVSAGSPVVRARAYVAAMAQYELHVNGQALYRGDSFTYPGEGYYQSTDITAQAVAGEPIAIGVLHHYWTCTCQGRANGPASPEGPAGLLVRVVVDHADGSREAFVSDGTWRVTKATMYTNSTLTTRNGDAGDRVERYDARLEIPGWDTVGFNDGGWANATVIGRHPRPTGFTHLNGGEHRLGYETVYPVSVQTLADGTVVADFGKVIPAMPGIRFENGVSGRVLTIQTSYRLLQTTLAANANPGDTNIKVASVASFTGLEGARIEIDSYTNKEVRMITVVGTAGAVGTGVTLDAPLSRSHASGSTVWGPKVGTATADTQGSNLSWFYTQKAGTQTAQAFTYWGWRYLQVNAPGPGETLDADAIFAVVQHSAVQPDHRARFESDNAVLNDAFELMMRSGIYSSHEVFVDTPTREKGQFLGDTVDISFANMLGWAERDATERAIREFVYSQIRYWNSGSNFGRLNAVYPNGDGMRDIPDYTEFLPGWVMRYHLMTGDKSLVQHAYQTMKNISTYVHNAIPTTGGAAGLVYNLPGGSGSYVNGIIDWPAPMRYGYPQSGNGARTIHNAEAVDTFRSTAAAAALLGNTADATLYAQWADELAATMNSKLLITAGPDAGLYSPGLSSTAPNSQLTGVYQHAQTYPIVYGVAPAANIPAMADRIVSLAMNQGPMTLHVLLKALALGDRPDQIVNLITNQTADGPGKVLANDGTFMWEQWNPTGAESHSHGWGSWALVDVLETLLGVQVTSPGAATVKIAPPQIGLQSARGSVWTQRGPVSVDWRRTPRGLVLDLELPVNLRGEVALPVQDSEQYSASGAGAPKFVGVRDGRAIFEVGSGASHFEANRPPVAVDDSATTLQDTPVEIDVLANDSDADGDTLSVTGVTQGENGSVTVNPDSTVTYTPNSGFVGADSFTYTIGDGRGATDSALVQVTVREPNKTTGGGWLADPAGEKLNFGFMATETLSGVEGQLQLNDRARAAKIHLAQVTSLGRVGADCGSVTDGPSSLEFSGSGTFNGSPGASFRVCVQDNGEGSAAPPDRFYLACTAGCSYTTGASAADDVVDGGNIQVRRRIDEPAAAEPQPTGGNAPGSAEPEPTTLILAPLLLSEGVAGQPLTLTVTVYDGNQEPLPDSGVVVTGATAVGSILALAATTDQAGTAIVVIAVPVLESEFQATAGNAESNTVQVTPRIDETTFR